MGGREGGEGGPPTADNNSLKVKAKLFHIEADRKLDYENYNTNNLKD